MNQTVSSHTRSLGRWYMQASGEILILCKIYMRTSSPIVKQDEAPPYLNLH